MKKAFLLALLALLPGLVWAQEDHFKVEDNQMVWQQIFQTDQTAEAVAGYLGGLGDIKDVRETSTGIAFMIKRSSPIELNKYGFKRGSVAAYAVLKLLEARGTVDFKDGRYRVTVGDVVFVSNDANAERTTLETYALSRKGEIKGVFYSMRAADLLEAYFTDLFMVKVKNNDEW